MLDVVVPPSGLYGLLQPLQGLGIPHAARRIEYVATVHVEPDRGGGTAVATGGLSILAKGFADRFLSSKDPCGDALKEIAERDKKAG